MGTRNKIALNISPKEVTLTITFRLPNFFSKTGTIGNRIKIIGRERKLAIDRI